MDFIERLQRVLRLRPASFVVFHAASVPADGICATICSQIGKKTKVVRLRSDIISADEGAFVRDSLLEDQTLVLIGNEHDLLPAQLLHAWQEFRDHHSYVSAHRFI